MSGGRRRRAGVRAVGRRAGKGEPGAYRCARNIRDAQRALNSNSCLCQRCPHRVMNFSSTRIFFPTQFKNQNHLPEFRVSNDLFPRTMDLGANTYILYTFIKRRSFRCEMTANAEPLRPSMFGASKQNRSRSAQTSRKTSPGRAAIAQSVLPTPRAASAAEPRPPCARAASTLWPDGRTGRSHAGRPWRR